jgi:plasmid stability protein
MRREGGDYRDDCIDIDIVLCSSMGQILIRNLDEAVLIALRQRAAQSGASLEEEARRALAMSVGLSRQGAIARLDAVREDIGRLEGPSALDDLRAGRRRDL